MFPFRKNKSTDAPRRRQAGAGDKRRERASEAELEQNYTFRRNRTLTGSSSSRVASVAEKTGDLQSARTQAHHLTLQRRKIMVVLGVVMIAALGMLGILYNFTGSPIVSSDDALTLDKQRYERAIDGYLGRHPIERVRPFLNEQRLSDYLRQNVPEVHSAEQNGWMLLGVTDFTLTMRRPIASWVLGGKQYFVDDQGIPFEKNYYEAPTVDVVDQSGVPQAPGAAVASSRFLAFVGRVVAEAKKYDFVVEQAIIPLGTTRQLEIKLQGRGYPIKLSLDRPAGEQVEDMKAALSYFDQHKQVPQYIDVRVSGKAFYK